jgi:hypothetical protein
MSYGIQGTLYLLGGVPFNNDYNHTIDFDNPTEQATYFQTKIVYTEGIATYTHIRKDGIVKIGRNIETLYGVNYIMYRNYTNTRWIYAFITDKTYISDNATAINIETDVFQTYQFDYSWKETFIEREHDYRWAGVNVPVYSLTEEGLTLGDEYIKESETTLGSFSGYYLVVASQQLESPDSYVPPNTVQSMATPLYYYLLNGNQNANTLISLEPAVVSISAVTFLTFDAASCSTVSYSTLDPDGNTITFNIFRIQTDKATSKVIGSVSKFYGMALPTAFATGVTRNKKFESKLLCYPYTYNVLTQYQGGSMVLKNEYLAGETISVTVSQNIAHEIKSKFFISSGYKGEYNGKENCLINMTLNDLPLVTDEYKNYMLTHKASIASGMAIAGIEGAGALVGGMASGNPLGIMAGIGTAANSAESIAMELARQKDLQTTPQSMRQMGNNVTFDFADGNLNIKVVRFSVHDDIKQILADYWSMFGYKSGRVKTPNVRTRYYYNYIRTRGANITGNIENAHMEKLKSIFNNGVTIWHYRSGVVPLSYQYDNVEMNLLP